MNSLPSIKNSDLSKLKAFAHNKLNAAKMMQFDSDWTENNVEYGENAGYQHFLHIPQCFLKLSFKRNVVWKKIKFCCCFFPFPIAIHPYKGNNL